MEYVFGFGVLAYWLLSPVISSIFPSRVDLPKGCPLKLSIEFPRFKGSGTFPTMRYNSLATGCAHWYAKTYFKKFHRYPSGKHRIVCMAGNKEEHDIVLPFGGDPITVRFAINFLPITTNVDDQNDAYDPAIVRTSIYLNRI